MYEFHPYFTNDGSVGLYSSCANDIYHSATGALTEAYEKFVYPVNFEKLLTKDKIKILDICYGIGYNTISVLNFILQNFILQNNYAPIYTDNVNRVKYNAATDTDNIFSKISITTVDNDKILYFLSPFIKTGNKNIKNQKIDFDYEKIYKFLQQDQKVKKLKINKIVNFAILEKIIEKSPEIFETEQFSKILYNKSYTDFFSSDIKALFKFYQSERLNNTSNLYKPLNLHNIYYKYISNRYKKQLKTYKLQDFNFEYKNMDARKMILKDSNLYNLIFLDAFTPTKSPCLWSVEFFKQLFAHLQDDGVLLTYSTSAAVRGAMIEAGFCIGNIYNERLEKFTGTIASKNSNTIKYQLSEFDFGLLKTKAGIPYRDKNLNAENEAIITARNFEVKNSDKISSSMYIKNSKTL